jgi:hypothetical protein
VKEDATAADAPEAEEKEDPTTTTDPATDAAAAGAEDDTTTDLSKTAEETEPVDEDEAAFAAAIASATSPQPDADADEDAFPSVSESKPPQRQHPGRQASISLQSKLRSTSFRDTAPAGPLSPSVSSMQRIEELERENKKLVDEAAEHESRWRRTEEELEELREEKATGEGKVVEGLRAEVESLRRAQRSDGGGGGGGKASRRESAANLLDKGSPGEDGVAAGHAKALEAKEAAIADMQLEISRLRGQLSSQTEGCETHGEQIAGLQKALEAAEGKLRGVEAELVDCKKALTRASEKAVKDGTERTSRDTRIRELERLLDGAGAKADEAAKKAETLEAKVEAMNKLHREAESRASGRLSAAEAASREVPALRAKVQSLEAENGRLREKHKRVMSGGGADEGVDELEDEERAKAEKRIRELEGQVFELQRGVWRDRRKEMQPGMDGASAAGLGRPSLEGRATEEGFDEVDLSGAAGSRRTSSYLGASRGATASPATQQKHSNFTQYLSSGFNAFMGPTSGPGSQGAGRPRNDSLLQDFDGDDDFGEGFDEAAFARAQREEEMKKMVEHVREVKRGLGKWKGWRLDLADTRRGEGVVGWGVGEVFEV